MKKINEGNVGYEETQAGERYQMAVLKALEEEGMTFMEADNIIDIEYELIGDCLTSGKNEYDCAEMIMTKNSAGIDESMNESSDYKNMLDDDMADTYEEIMDYLRSFQNQGDTEDANLTIAKIMTNLDVVEDEALYDMIRNNEDTKEIADYIMDNHYIGLGPKAKKKRLEYLEKYGDVSEDLDEGKKPSKKQDKKIGKVMGEYKNKKLKTSAGKKVTDKKQAFAIAASEAGINEGKAKYINENIFGKSKNLKTLEEFLKEKADECEAIISDYEAGQDDEDINEKTVCKAEAQLEIISLAMDILSID